MRLSLTSLHAWKSLNRITFRSCQSTENQQIYLKTSSQQPKLGREFQSVSWEHCKEAMSFLHVWKCQAVMSPHDCLSLSAYLPRASGLSLRSAAASIQERPPSLHPLSLLSCAHCLPATPTPTICRAPDCNLIGPHVNQDIHGIQRTGTVPGTKLVRKHR